MCITRHNDVLTTLLSFIFHLLKISPAFSGSLFSVNPFQTVSKNMQVQAAATAVPPFAKNTYVHKLFE